MGIRKMRTSGQRSSFNKSLQGNFQNPGKQKPIQAQEAHQIDRTRKETPHTLLQLKHKHTGQGKELKAARVKAQVICKGNQLE